MFRMILMLQVIWAGLSVAQELHVVAVFPSSNPSYQSYYMPAEHVMANSFAVEHNKIYLPTAAGALTIWNYLLPFSDSNPEAGPSGDWSKFKTDSDLAVGSASDVLDIRSFKTLRLFDLKEETNSPIDESSSFFCISDSVVYFVCHTLSVKNPWVFLNYDLRQRKKDTVILRGFISFVDQRYAWIRDIFVSDGELHCLFQEPVPGSDRDTRSVAICWDLHSDTLLSIIHFPKRLDHPRFVGTDRWGNIYVLSGVALGEYPLEIFSPKMAFISECSLDSAVKRIPFMKGNRYFLQDNADGYMIAGSFSRDKQLYFMVKTKKGLYFLSCDYLPLLKNHFMSMSSKQLRIARNTIFARHGMIFKSPDLQEYFSHESWYKPNRAYNDSLLTVTDKRWIHFLTGIETHKTHK